MNRVATYILLLGSIAFFLGDLPAVSSALEQNKPLQFNPPNNGAPEGKRTAANTGSRDDCPTVDKAITALVPETNWGNTISPRPTLWFYIPYQQGLLTMVIKDEGTTAKVAQLTYNIEAEGIMGFPLPETAPSLEVNRAYRWQVFFTCDAKNQQHFTKIQGVIKRVAVGENLPISLPVKEKIALYAQQGLWHETIGEIIKFRRDNPDNKELDTYWLDLLASDPVKLEDFSSEPLVNCCKYITQ